MDNSEPGQCGCVLSGDLEGGFPTILLPEIVVCRPPSPIELKETREGLFVHGTISLMRRGEGALALMKGARAIRKSPAEVLDDKLRARQQAHTEQVWNLSRWPTGFTEEGEKRLFVAVNSAWRGYFTLSRDALYNPNDPSAPFGLLLDTRSWTPIGPVPVKRFRGFTYSVPRANSTGTASPPDTR